MDLIDIKPHYKKNAWIKSDDYKTLYQQSITEPEKFWAEQAREHLDFIKPFSITRSGNFNRCKWFEDGTLNVSLQCIDRHLSKRANQTAIIWQSDEQSDSKHISYQELHDEVCRMSNILKKHGVQKGDRVCIYLPMVPEAAYAMLACARIGAVHSVVFAGFSAQALQSRINDAHCKVLISTAISIRGGKTIALIDNIEQAIKETPSVEHVLLIKTPSSKIKFNYLDWSQEKLTVPAICKAEEMASEDPLFILYTSGSTGKPKGIVHSSGGYILYAALTFKYVFDYHDNDIYWCSADVGWVTGHSYIVYGPLANGATTLIFEGTPTYPNPSRFWQVIDKHKVNIFYTAPTAIRALMKEGDDWLSSTSRSSLKLLGSVGEPINPEAWRWYYNKVGNKQCPIVDTWWQTETGGIMLSPLPGVTKLKPGYAQMPFFGIEPVLLDDDGKQDTSGRLLAIKQPWPGMARTIYNDQNRYNETYFDNNCYMAGDEAEQDEHNNFKIIGRVDDVLNVSGHRLGTAEIESALAEHPAVAEAAVVSMKHPIKGEAIYAYVTLMTNQKPSTTLKKEIINKVREIIGPIASPEVIQWTDELPKTRSGKIMRRILRKIANKDYHQLGDLSTLAMPKVVEKIIADRLKEQYI